MKISLVVPVYNTEKFLNRCLSSLISQNVPSEDVEIIIVDDGSTDGSSKIIDNFVNRFANLRKISQVNTGLGAARNAGIEVASGEYIWFIDSDDFIKEGCLEKIVDQLDGLVDAVAFNFSCADEDGNDIKWVDFKFVSDGCPEMTGPRFFNLNFKWTYCWLFVFKRELFLKNEIRFESRINMQDAELLPRFLYCSKIVKLINVDAYTYVKRKSSYINSNDKSVRERYFDSVITVYGRLSSFYKSVSKNSLDMDEGLIKKLESIKEILFLSYAYDDMNVDAARNRLSKLKDNGLYPFDVFLQNDGLLMQNKFRIILKILLNLFPLFTLQVFRVVRGFKRSALLLLK